MSAAAETRKAIIEMTRLKGPMTAKQIALDLGIVENSIRTSIRRARENGSTKYLRIADWQGGVPKYGPGPEDDVPGGSTGQMILCYLYDGTRATVSDLAKAIGMPDRTVDAAIRRLRKKPGQLRIVDWKLRRGQRGGREAAVYAKGPGKDAKRPDFTNSKIESWRRRNELRRVAKGLAGQRRAHVKKKSGPVSGIFDALMR